MSRSTATQAVQIGREVTPGTAVPADVILSGLSLMLNPSVESDVFRPKGYKYPTLVTANKEWSSGSIEGTATYEELVVLLAAVMGQPVTAEILDTAIPTGAYRWTFSPQSSGIDTPQTYTLEQGDAEQGSQAAYGLITDMDLDVSRSEIKVGGSVFAGLIDNAAGMTAGATALVPDLHPIQPGQVCIYVAATHAGLDSGTDSDPAARWPNALSIHPSIGGRFNPVWFLNCTQDSFSGHVEAPEPDYALDFLVEADASGLAFLDDFRAGATKFVRIEATGPEIYSGGIVVKHRLRWDFAVKVLEPGEKSDEDGVYAVQPNLQVVHDATWGHASTVEVINTVASIGA